MIGLHDLTFFSVQGTAFGREVVAAARGTTEQTLRTYFASKHPVSHALNR